MSRIVPLAAVISSLVTWSSVAAQADPAAPTCTSSYARLAAPADRLAQAAADLRACRRQGTLTPRATRRLLSAINTLRDSSDYDLRRAWGTTAGWRARRVNERLDRIMALASGPPAAPLGATN